MAFLLSNWGRVSTSANEPIVTLGSGVIVGAPRVYSYYTLDTQAVVSASAYFNAIINDLSVGDIIMVYYATLGMTADLLVTSVTTNVTVANVGAAGVATGTLTAANILAMNGAPVAIANLPAPGAGFAYEIYGLTLNKLAGTVAYANGGAIGLTWGTGGSAATGTIAATLLTGAAGTPTYGVAGPIATTGVSGASTLFANLGIFITNATAPFINGDSLVNYRIPFRVVPIV